MVFRKGCGVSPLDLFISFIVSLVAGGVGITLQYTYSPI
jgi:hypothetical protein